MAESNSLKKPRIRSTAPTVRERAAIAQEKAEHSAKPKRLGVVVSRASQPLRKLRPRINLHLPNNRFGKIIRFVGKILGWFAPRYFINAWREVRQVTWPGRKETWRLTLAVFIFALVFGTAIYGVDKGLDDLFKKFVLK